jgi:hypothetical protein
MKDLLPFMMEHPFISFFMLYTVCEATRQIICHPLKRLLRHLDIKRNGWPPVHCDADGDFKPAPETDEA